MIEQNNHIGKSIKKMKTDHGFVILFVYPSQDIHETFFHGCAIHES